MVTLRNRKVDSPDGDTLTLTDLPNARDAEDTAATDSIAEGRLDRKQLAQAAFLQSPHVKTRASGPAPSIDLSTELPELSQILAKANELAQNKVADPASTPADMSGAKAAGKAGKQLPVSPPKSVKEPKDRRERSPLSAQPAAADEAVQEFPWVLDRDRGLATQHSDDAASNGSETDTDSNQHAGSLLRLAKGTDYLAGRDELSEDNEKANGEGERNGDQDLDRGSEDGTSSESEASHQAEPMLVQNMSSSPRDEARISSVENIVRETRLGNSSQRQTEVPSESLGFADSGAPDGDIQTRSDSDSGNDSDDESDSDGQLSGLAKSMWSALQSRHDRSATDQPTARMKQMGAVPQSRSHDAGQADVAWKPQSQLPKPLQSKDLISAATNSEPNLSKQLMAVPRDKKTEAAQKAANKERSWHDLPEQVITDELKRDLRLLRLRGTMDTKRFYKKADKGKFPSKFAIGTVIEGPTEFFSGRLTNKERRQTITEEILANPEIQASRKRRFNKMQEESQKWSRKKYKGSGERAVSRKKRPKH